MHVPGIRYGAGGAPITCLKGNGRRLAVTNVHWDGRTIGVEYSEEEFTSNKTFASIPGALSRNFYHY